MKQKSSFAGKVLYAFLFLVLVPAGLWLWARSTQPFITLPAVKSVTAGWVLMGLGLALMLLSMYYLKQYGKGLPMNAYPPPVLVTGGPYRLLHHPIYWGFGLLLSGWFIYEGSASGLWLVTPVTILAMMALVMGYEGLALRQRFPGKQPTTLLDLPQNNQELPVLHQRIAAVFWLLLFLYTGNLLVATASGNTVLPFTTLSADPQSIDPIFISLALIVVVPFLLQQQAGLRRWVIASCITVVCFAGCGLLCSFSSAVIVPLVFVAIAWILCFHQSKPTGWLLLLPALLLITVLLMRIPSPLLHLAASVLLFCIAFYYRSCWHQLKNLAERIANSWQEWVFGKIRIINHGLYVGVGAFAGVLLAGTLAGEDYAVALLIFSIIVTICAALWAQLIEGSEKLKRPFGYYGGLVGILAGSPVVWLMGYNVWVILGVVAVAMPWVQAIGRLRCLVNGCCHGGRTHHAELGIRYTHPRSRVCTISHLKGALLHPTPLYSILWLTPVGLLLLTLWLRGCSMPLILGLYLILTSLGRFVEEAYRGEAQTPVIKGLRLYQWTAIVALVTGICITVIKVQIPALQPGFSMQTLAAAAFTGLFLFFAMGVDFPYSNARFSRLV